MKKQIIYPVAGIAAAFIIVSAFFLLGNSSSAREEIANSPGTTVSLPEPRHDSELSVEEAIFSRTSVRSFSSDPLTLEEAGQLLWSAAGKTVDGVTGATRAYPSAGGIYPLEVYLAAGQVENLEPGIYRYNWREHALEKIIAGDQRQELTRAAMGQNMVAEAPASLVLTADVGSTARRYGSRGEDRYVPMDVGGAGQNVHLQAESLGLGTVIIGAFNLGDVQNVLGGTENEPLYIMPVGTPGS